jgi:hypothetical protein
MNYLGGHKNSMTFGIAAPQVATKADALVRALWEVAGPPDQFAAVDVNLIGGETQNPRTNDDALAYLRVSVKDPDPDKVGRRFSSAAVELALSSYPGFFLTTPPGEATAYAVYWPTTIPASLVPMRVVMEDRQWEVTSVAPETPDARRQTPDARPQPSDLHPDSDSKRTTQDAPRITVPLGTIAGARSGDKGGNANVGFWVRSLGEYRWLDGYLTVERIRTLMPEAAGLEIDRFELPNLLAVNFVIHGLLGEGVSSSTRTDPQAKSLGEFLRACWVEVPKDLVGVSK